MQLYYQDDLVEIWNGNSVKLTFLKNNSIHMVITSPPYNTGKQYDNHNDRMNLDDYLDMLYKVFKECYRVLTRGGRIAVNVPSCLAQTTYSKIGFVAVEVHNILKEIGFIPLAWIYWFKVFNEGKNFTSWGSWKSPSCPSVRDSGDEYIIVMAKETAKLEGDKENIDITKQEFMKYTINRWEILPETSNRKYHPAPFPFEIPYRLIKLYTYKGNTVLDPFMGIGTTLMACKKTQRKGIGVDISEKYCEIAKRFLSQREIF